MGAAFYLSTRPATFSVVFHKNHKIYSCFIDILTLVMVQFQRLDQYILWFFSLI